MIQLAYTSIAKKEMRHGELICLLQQARMFNIKEEITGILLYKDKSFFQVIEGDNNKIDKLMMSIAEDHRHHSITILYRRQTDKRDFNLWSMGYINIDEEQHDLDKMSSETFRFPMQDVEGNLSELINIHSARSLVKRYSIPAS